jgi:valyl-tRNA synthetase
MEIKPKLKEKRWSKDLEKEVYTSWKDDEAYRFRKNADKPVYSIDTPPPYVNTPVHIGQATTYVLMDMFARYRRMTGHNVLFPLGLDRNGLPIEMAVEQKFNIKLKDVSREEFLEKCKVVLEESTLASTESFLRLGIGFNSWRVGTGIGDIYLTDSTDYRALTQETFIDLWNKGLIYEAERINNYCPGCGTTIADAEIEYAELPTTFNEIIFKVKETGESIIIGTTRPELLCTCAMVIFNPKDDRYKHLDGKTAITPIFNKEVMITSHPMAEMEKGTGLVMMCSMGDTSDIRFFREMNLTPVIAIDEDGRMNSNAGFLEGMEVTEARKKIIERLRENGLLVAQKQVLHRTPVCERSKDPVEFIAMQEFYVKQVEFKDDMKRLVEKINFYSPASKHILLNWIDSVSIDWPISRRRYYATEVPLWYCKTCGENILPPKGRYYRPWKEDPPIEECPKCGGNEFLGEERVLDTWFDSSITPLYILKYSRDDEFFNSTSPCSLRPQGKEIVRTWLYYTLLKDYLLTGKCIFRDVWINYHIVDEDGRKMSKSKGNVIDPKAVLDRFGAEPFRLWAAVEGNLDKTDFRCSMERIQGAGKTITKLWNVARFVSMFPYEGERYELTPLDSWVLREANALINLAREKYEVYNFHEPAIRIKHFLWETFASHYVELVKNRAYNRNNFFTKEKQMGAIYTLNKCLDIILMLLAPVIPLITYKIYMSLRGRDIHFQDFLTPEEYESPFSTKEIEDLNKALWRAKKEKGLSLRDEVKMAILPEKFRSVADDVVGTHHIKEVSFGGELKLEF